MRGLLNIEIFREVRWCFWSKVYSRRKIRNELWRIWLQFLPIKKKIDSHYVTGKITLAELKIKITLFYTLPVSYCKWRWITYTILVFYSDSKFVITERLQVSYIASATSDFWNNVTRQLLSCFNSKNTDKNRCLPVLAVNQSPSGCSAISTRYVTGMRGPCGIEGFQDRVKCLSVILLMMGLSGNGSGAPLVRNLS